MPSLTWLGACSIEQPRSEGDEHPAGCKHNRACKAGQADCLGLRHPGTGQSEKLAPPGHLKTPESNAPKLRCESAEKRTGTEAQAGLTRRMRPDSTGRGETLPGLRLMLR